VRREAGRVDFYLQEEYFGILLHKNKAVETRRAMNFGKKPAFC